MNRFFRSLFLPLLLAALAVSLITSRPTSLSDVLSALLPVALLAAFWLYLLMQTRRLRNEPGSQNQVREFQGAGAGIAKLAPVVAMAVIIGVAWSVMGAWSLALGAFGLVVSLWKSRKEVKFGFSKRVFPASAGGSISEKQVTLTLPRIGGHARDGAVAREPEPSNAKELEKRIGLGG